MTATRASIADLIAMRLEGHAPEASGQWRDSGPVNHAIIDDLLPEDLAHRIRAAFPAGGSMKIKRSLREFKHVSAQMDRHDPVLEECVYAFQDPRVVDAITRITGLSSLEPDELLYAGGISMMSRGHFLNPHIDNSHDKQRERYRVLNLLYYVSPRWTLQHGGNLELWPDGVKAPQQTVESRFNRLVLMITNEHSWHSVSKVLADDQRCCVSNYYFSKYPAQDQDYYHVTSFRGRPDQPLRDVVLIADNALKNGIMKSPLRYWIDNPHYYAKKRK
jgi:Rps23 Pro-64 3,4-dihydroxylase Tpa1-like proline 4-hydroxylase